MDYLDNIQGDKRSNDPDDTLIAISFYIDKWRKKLELTNIEDYEKRYRGETLISFATLAGAYIRCLDQYNGSNMPGTKRGRLEFIINAKDASVDDKMKFSLFYHLYHSCANFIPFPKNKKEYNFNSIKGSATGKYKDFPDIFFKDIKAYFDGEKEIDFLANAKNRNYLNKFTCWNDFVESNYLQDYFKDDEYKEFKKIKVAEKIPYTKKYMSDSQKKEYKAAITKSIELSISIIILRANRF